MYGHVKEAVDCGKVLLEWNSADGTPPAPLLKDAFPGERKQAKGINFSIAYGKTSYGFAAEWGCSIEQAEQSVEKWYSERAEVRQWQKKTQQIAIEKGWTQTLLGRYRNLIRFLVDNKLRSHGLRAAINTPIQVYIYIYQIGWSC